MTDRDRVALDDLADLHAGLLPEDEATALRGRVQSDPDASAYLTTLDSVSRTLRTHASDPEASGSIPPAVAARLQAALAVPPLDTRRTQWARRTQWSRRTQGTRRRTVLTAAAAAVVVVALGAGAGIALSTMSSEPTGTAVAGSAPRDKALDRSNVMSLIGSFDQGRLTDDALLAGCLEANGIPATTTVVGSGSVTVDGIDATVLVTAGATPGSLVAVAVGPSCGPGNADLVSRADIG